MKIKRLKLSGFKSFVDPAELRIERGLTGIVGPNGCGKSNLLEAIRWVMGEGSAKSLRGGAMDDVIFAGTAQRPARDFAEVSILAERGEEAANDDREIEIVRRIERGAGSAYRLNGRDVRAKDVGLVFADAATGAHSPALVSQGKIGAIIAAKPAARREMLEEAAGISGLHVRRKDAEQKLRATETNLNRLNEVLSDMEARTAALKRQARAAERYRKLSAEIRVAEGKLIFTRWREAAALADAAKAEARQAEAEVNRATEAQKQVQLLQNQAVQKLAALRADAMKAREVANDAGHKLTALKTERAALDRRISELSAQADRLKIDREREGELAHDASEALARLAQEITALEARIAENESGRPALANKVISAEAQARDAEVELAQALSTQAKEQAETRVADAAMAAASSRLERAQRDLAQAEAARDALGDEAPLILSRDNAEAALKEAEETAKNAAAQTEQAEQRRDAASAARETAQAGLAAAQATLSALEGEIRALEKALASHSVEGRILESVSAEQGFELALAAALGDDLDAGLDTDASRYWAGATADNDPTLPAGLDSLAKHVKAPAQLARRLAQIGVGPSDDGAPLSVGQRFVTLDGRLRRWDGYISRDQGAATAERLIRQNRLDAVQSELASAQAEVETARLTSQAAQTTIEAARQEADQGRRSLSEAEARARTAARDLDQALTALERLANRKAEMGERLERISGECAEAESETRAAHTSRLALPDGSATAKLVSQLQSTAESARSLVAIVKTEAATLDRSLSDDKSRKGSAEIEINGWKSRAGEAARRIDEMAKRAQQAEQEAKALADAPAELDQKIHSLSQETQGLAQAAEQAAEEERRAEISVREIEANVAEAGEALATMREARAGAVARAENQELRRIEMGRVSGERFECPPPLLPEKVGFDEAEVRDPSVESAQHDRLVADRERLGPVNLVAEQELEEIEGEYSKSIVERDELTEAISRLRGSIGSLNREGRVRLLAAFDAVNGHFQRLFTTLFNGGQAHLALIDSDDPLEAGLEIMAQPPGKKLQSLTLLSGGEQALTAVALIFGLFLTNPAPICVLDEVDAPLDDANIERFCGLLDAMTRETDTRYLIVTHNAVTMSRMHRLFGVTMIEQGVSRLVSVDLGGAEELIAAE